MRTISHSELRNGSAQILRDAQQGQHMLVTNRGKVVASIGPAQTDPADLAKLLHPAEPARLREIVRERRAEPTATMLEELRGER